MASRGGKSVEADRFAGGRSGAEFVVEHAHAVGGREGEVGFQPALLGTVG